MSRSLSYIFPAGNTTDVCVLQSLAGAGNLVLNGNLVNPITNQVSFIAKGYSRSVSITSTNNLSGSTFTVNGIQNGLIVTENITGPDSTIVYGTKIYDVITSISVNGAVNAVSIGSGWKGFFPLIGINLERDFINYTLTLARLTASSVNFAVHGTLANIINNGQSYLDQLNNTKDWFPIEAFSDNAQYSYAGLDITYTYILVQLGEGDTTINNSMKLNFIQI